MVAQKPELCCNSKHSYDQITVSNLLLSIGCLFAHKYINGTHTHHHASQQQGSQTYRDTFNAVERRNNGETRLASHAHQQCVFWFNLWKHLSISTCIIACNAIRYVSVSVWVCIYVCLCASCLLYVVKGRLKCPQNRAPAGDQRSTMTGVPGSRCLVGSWQV